MVEIHCVANECAGQNNAYHANTGSSQAERSHDLSVLEFNSLTIMVDLLKQKDLNFMAGFSKKKRITLRKAIIELVLSTDFSRHFE
eukprot:scaffold175515_cov45-Prasinocladus_malaysianus.AAC.2